MSQLSFQDFRDKIKIQDIAASLGYWVNPLAGSKQLSMCLGDRKSPTEEIIIYNYNDSSRSTYFSRNGGIADKGNLINFVQFRLKELGATKDGIPGVNEVLNRYLNNDLDIKKVVATAAPVQTHKFNLEYWRPNPIEDCSIKYLNQRRYLSLNTISDFSDRCHIYTVGKNKHVGFPFREPGRMDILNYEMRNYFSSNNQNYKGFCSGGEKTKSCWIANFCDYNKVTDLYLFESAIDAISFYEIKGFTKETTSAFISFGGYVTNTQVEALHKIFPNANYHLCFDNDIAGQCFDVMTAHTLRSEHCKAYVSKSPSIQVVVDFGDRKDVFAPETFSSSEYLKSIDKNIDIIKPATGKDWNELLSSYKRFDLNLNENKAATKSLDSFCSSLNLAGYTDTTTIIERDREKILKELLSNGSYEMKQLKIASVPCKDFTADMVLIYRDGVISYSLNKAQIFENTTQQIKPAHKVLVYFEEHKIDIMKKFHKSDFEDLLKKKDISLSDGAQICLCGGGQGYVVNDIPLTNITTKAIEL